MEPNAGLAGLSPLEPVEGEQRAQRAPTNAPLATAKAARLGSRGRRCQLSGGRSALTRTTCQHRRPCVQA
eukprot:10256568-Alexandrium_andersonii.AAC.1